MKGERGGILGSCNRTREYKDGGRESEGSVRVADIKVCQGYTKVFRIGKLLLLIH